MRMLRLSLATVAAAAGFSFSGCTDYGYYRYGGGYGYSSYYPAYSLGSYYYPSYYGWYGNRYYPGVGIYVYDRDRRAYRISDSQRRYWSAQRERVVRSSPTVRERRVVRENWSGFNRGRPVRMERASQRRNDRRDRDDDGR